MYEHRNPTIGRDMTIPGSIGKKPSKPVESKKPVCEQPVEKPIEDKKPDCKPVKDKKPVEDKKPVKDDKKAPEDEKKVDPWARLLFGPPRPAKPVQTEPTDDKTEKRPGFWWI
ncbi:hypothetical protein [Halalkalibacter alkalisediminis]|uniref:Uncharacterized protein n=1 Tax=Halalkalibacter alkalisediminis TaxID=935616 RepID=A0ABV6NDR3_9BACI|nr:hypothetical protein [Halalkalibacter alkalisediminis]